MARRINRRPIAFVFPVLVALLSPVFSANEHQPSRSGNPGPTTGAVSTELSKPGQSPESNLPHQVALPNEISISLTNKTRPGFLNILSTAGPIVLTGVSIVVTFILGLGRYNRRKDRISVLESQLNSFHRPLLQLLETSGRLHETLVENRPPDFRTLPALLDRPEEFDEVDRVIIEQIVDVGRELEEIIQKQSGHLLDESLRSPLGDLSRHLRIFRLAAQERLRGQPERFRKFVYPRDVNKEILKEYKRLTEELNRLREKNW